MKPIRKLLVANRSEIAIRVFRTAHELGIRTVAIYSHEDRYALHRFKADEAYLVGKPGEPIRAYLDIDGIIAVAKRARRRRDPSGLRLPVGEPGAARGPATQAGITFVGPRAEVLEQLGDKTAARDIGQEGRRAGPGRQRRADRERRRRPDRSPSKLGYPVILKAAQGGGGRGMRVVKRADEFAAEPGAGPARGGARRSAAARRLRREVHPPGAAHRSAAARRPARQPGASVRARLLGAAAASEGRRDRAGAESRRRPCDSRSATRRWRSAGRSTTRTPAPSSSWSMPTPASSTSSRSIRGFRSSTRSPRR